MSEQIATRLTQLGHGRIDAVKMKPSDIIIRKDWNYRDVTTEEARTHIAWLKESIREMGVQKPLEVQFMAGKAYLVDGECRLRAALELEKEVTDLTVPVLGVKGDEAVIRAKSMVANGALPPSKLEFGKAAQLLRDYGWTDEQIEPYCPPHIRMRGIKHAKRFIKDAVDLHNAPIAIKDAVKNGVDGIKVSPAAAVAIARKHPLEAADFLKQKAAEAKATGKTEINRDKTDGVTIKAKKAAEAKTQDLFLMGDRLADLVLGESMDWDAMLETAKAWKKGRK